LVAAPLLYAVSQSASARIMAIADHDFEALARRSDLIAIARVVASEGVDEETTLPGIAPPVQVVGIETRFLVTVPLWGELTNNLITLHHYRQRDPKPFRNGPMLASFKVDRFTHYLLFLKREADGRYAPAAGQTDAAICLRRIPSPIEGSNAARVPQSEQKSAAALEEQYERMKARTDVPLTVGFVRMESDNGVTKRGVLNVTNNTSKAVYRCVLQFFFFNGRNELFETSQQGMSAAAGFSYIEPGAWKPVWASGRTDNYDTSRVEAAVTSVEFTDGSKWQSETGP
jgi:hypothetical protein